MEEFKRLLKELEIELTDKQFQQFDQFYNLLVEWNKVMNLTGITEYNQVIEKHFVDSLSIVKAVNLEDNMVILDVGTGAGFPGVPIKIAFPNVKVILLDSLNKRIKFLDAVIDELGLENIETIHGRAEELAQNVDYRGQVNLVVSRAVANLSSLSEYCIPFIKVGGKFISYKSGKIQKELDKSKHAIHVLGGKLDKVVEFKLGEAERTLIVINKQSNTSKRYPRKAGLPTKEPIE